MEGAHTRGLLLLVSAVLATVLLPSSLAQAECELDIPDRRLSPVLQSDEIGIIEFDPVKLIRLNLTYLCSSRDHTGNYKQARVSLHYRYDYGVPSAVQATFKCFGTQWHYTPGSITTDEHYSETTVEVCRDCMESRTFARPSWCSGKLHVIYTINVGHVRLQCKQMWNEERNSYTARSTYMLYIM